MWTRTAWQKGIHKVSIRQRDPSERGLHSLGNPLPSPQALDWARTVENQMKSAKGREELPDENKDTEEAEERLRIAEQWC